MTTHVFMRAVYAAAVVRVAVVATPPIAHQSV